MFPNSFCFVQQRFKGSIFGLSPITSYIESGAGVEAGAKTGLTAVICSFYFFISIFFAPILASIPPWAVGGALIIVGALMARSLAKLEFNRVSHAVSGFLTVIVMPLTYSIAYGLIAGIMMYCVIEGAIYVLSFFGISAPDEEENTDKHIIGKSFRNITGAKNAEVDEGEEPEKVETLEATEAEKVEKDEETA